MLMQREGKEKSISYDFNTFSVPVLIVIFLDLKSESSIHYFVYNTNTVSCFPVK